MAKTELIIHVKPNGKLNYIGHYHQHVKNPIIEIVFDNNRAGEFKDAAWIKSVIKSLKIGTISSDLMPLAIQWGVMPFYTIAC